MAACSEEDHAGEANSAAPPVCARAPVGASATPTARSRALQPVLLRIGRYSSVTFGAGPQCPCVPRVADRPAAVAAAGPPIRSPVPFLLEAAGQYRRRIPCQDHIR